VETVENLLRNDSWVPGLGFGIEWIRSALDTIGMAIGFGIERPNTPFFPFKRWSDRWWSSMRRNKVMDDVLDKQTLALRTGKYAVAVSSQASRPASSKYNSTARKGRHPVSRFSVSTRRVCHNFTAKRVGMWYILNVKKMLLLKGSRHETPHLLARLCNEEGSRMIGSCTGWGDSDLSTLFLDSV